MKRTVLWQLLPSYIICIFLALATYVGLEAVDKAGIYSPISLFCISLVISSTAALFLARLIIQTVRRPILDIKRGAEQFVRGELLGRLYISEPEELSALASTLNRVGFELEKKFRAVADQRNELDATLDGLREGVLVLDADRKIVSLNGAAEMLLGINEAAVIGKTIYEGVRNAGLQRVIERALVSTDPVQADVQLYDTDTKSRSLDVYARRLSPQVEGNPVLLVVLNDMTDIRRLETMRRDFVANVSHELKTPITSIKGFVETLQDGAINDPKEAARFLEIIGRQSERLAAIIDDLLSLSRIEGSDDRGELVFEECSVSEVLNTAVQPFNTHAEEKSVTLKIDSCEADLPMNRNLIEQAVGNLVDNALKVSEAGSVIEVRSYKASTKLIISVSDQGPGIEREHLERIFERFYRVDKGRSRKQGGTGLGLAIVKHIALAHGGSVSVDSKLGQGTTFIIELPLQRT